MIVKTALYIVVVYMIVISAMKPKTKCLVFAVLTVLLGASVLLALSDVLGTASDVALWLAKRIGFLGL